VALDPNGEQATDTVAVHIWSTPPAPTVDQVDLDHAFLYPNFGPAPGDGTLPEGASGNDWQIATMSDFSDGVINPNGLAGAPTWGYDFWNLQPDTTYYARYRAVAEGGIYGPWSESTSFTTDAANTDPWITGENAATEEDAPVSFNLSWGDLEDGSTLTPSVWADNGTITQDTLGGWWYAPNSGFTGTDTIHATVTDSGGATASVDLDVDVAEKKTFVKVDFDTATTGQAYQIDLRIGTAGVIVTKSLQIAADMTKTQIRDAVRESLGQTATGETGLTITSTIPLLIEYTTKTGNPPVLNNLLKGPKYVSNEGLKIISFSLNNVELVPN